MCPCVPVSGMSLACRGFWGSTFSVIICVPALCVSVCLFLCLWDMCLALLLVEVENRKVAAASLCLSRDHRALGSSPGQESCWTRWLFLKFLTSSSSSHHLCGRLTLAGCQAHRQLFSHCPFHTGQGEKIRRKILWSNIKEEKSFTDYHSRQNRLD